LRHYAQGHGRLPKRLTEDAEVRLREYGWPGNVRELSHLMERLMLLRTEAIVSVPTLEELCLPRPSPGVREAAPPDRDHAEPLDEPARIRQALSQTGYNVVRAAHL
jgi:transcriptional regulator with PAS, ATPase and Fis domain